MAPLTTTMCEEPLTFSLDLTHTYLEVARAAAGPLPILHSSGDLDRVLEEHGHNPVANAIFGVVSLTVIYSYLAVESRVNQLLYRLWERRHDGSAESSRLLAVLGDQEDFMSYRGRSEIRDLPDRIKTLCDFLGYRRPHDVIPTVWQDFLELSRKARHYLIHPVPVPALIQQRMTDMLHELELGKWVSVAADLLSFLYQEGGMNEPKWLSQNTLLRIEGIRLILGEPGAA